MLATKIRSGEVYEMLMSENVIDVVKVYLPSDGRTAMAVNDQAPLISVMTVSVVGISPAKENLRLIEANTVRKRVV